MVEFFGQQLVPLLLGLDRIREAPVPRLLLPPQLVLRPVQVYPVPRRCPLVVQYKPRIRIYAKQAAAIRTFDLDHLSHAAIMPPRPSFGKNILDTLSPKM